MKNRYAVLYPTGDEGKFERLKTYSTPQQAIKAWLNEGGYIAVRIKVALDIMDGKIILKEQAPIEEGEGPFFKVNSGRRMATYSACGSLEEDMFPWHSVIEYKSLDELVKKENITEGGVMKAVLTRELAEFKDRKDN